MQFIRKTIYGAVLLLSAFGFSACSDYLDKENSTELDLELVFNDKERVEGWLGYVYSGIPDPYLGYLQRTGWDILSDDITPSERYRQFSGWGVIPFLLGEWTTNSNWDASFWSAFPQRIREANIFMQRVHALSEQGITPTEVDYMKAECRFLKAYYYALLANTYGGIPFAPDEITPTNFNLGDLMVGQTPYDKVIDWCDKELLAASRILPAKYTEARKYGRATSVMCLAVRARMLLYAASPLVNGNPDYVNYKNVAGENIFSTTYDANKWKKAAQACKELIQTAEANGYKLYEVTNANGDIDPFMSYQDMMFKRFDEGNTEILFPRPGGNDYGYYEALATPLRSSGNGGLGVTQSLVDAFFTENGLPITDPASGYQETGFSTADEDRADTKWGTVCNGGHITRQGTYNMYCHREPRFYISVVFNKAYFNSENRLYNMFRGDGTETDNNGTHDAPQNGYFVKKKVWYADNIKQGSKQYRPGILYRLGEAYLNYAEALNESDPGNADILVYLNRIRERAGVRPYTTGATDNDHIHVDLSNQDEMRKLIHAERRVELNCEGLRYDDLRRWKEAEQTLTGPFYGMNAAGRDANSFYRRTVYQTRLYKKAFYWFPIHQSEIDKNPNLRQAPYWE